MIYDLPTSVTIGETEYAIRNQGDYRVILDCIIALNDVDLTDEQKIQCALYIFYENIEDIGDIDNAVKEMFRFINYGEEETDNGNRPQLMDWEQDFKHIISPVNRVLGSDIRSLSYLHWWSFLGGYMEIGECVFSTIVAIRNKLQRGKKLESWEKDFYRENRSLVTIKYKLTASERAWLDNEC